MRAAPVVFASPHSGQFYPDCLLSKSKLDLLHLRRTEDAFVDELFGAAPAHGAWLVSAVFARTFVDLNREADEIDPDMFVDGPRATGQVRGERVRAGLGCLPRVAAGGAEIYGSPLSWTEGRRRIEHVYHGYHDAVRRLVAGAAARGDGRAILVDCHSMPSMPGRVRRLPDFVLGDRFGASCSYRLMSVLERTLRRMGYSVGRNAPYAGGHTTRHYGRPSYGIHAVQIEINRRLYMDEHKVERSPGFASLQRDIGDLIGAITDPGLFHRL